MLNKAETLLLLQQKLISGKVLKQHTIDLQTFHKLVEKKLSVSDFFKLEPDKKYVVRSSFSGEDTIQESNAGKYLSVTNVAFSDLEVSISKVFSSYENSNKKEIVLIQEYLENTVRSGVVFSHNPNNSANYVIDNYVLSKQTDEITSGKSHGFKHVCFRFKFESSDGCQDKVCLKLRKIIDECQNVLGIKHLDLEYAIDNQDEIYVFQARPLIVRYKNNLNVVNEIQDVITFVNSNMKIQPFLAGDFTIYGVMPDWNPAEMIGRRPKQLAMSLYRELITDSIWAYQRDNYGYKTLRSFPLMVELGHQPYIDTRVSFNSLLPKGLTSELENKLVNHYLDKLSKNRHYHDKVEFEVILSSWTFDIDERIDSLPNNINTEERKLIKNQLIELTKFVIKSDVVDHDIYRVSQLTERKKSIHEKSESPISELYWLLEDCKRWGTLPFAGLARAAFISTQIIKSLEKLNGDSNIFNKFSQSLNTITSQMASDFIELNINDFLAKYGHLRPGTYDITSKTYKEAFNDYFGDIILKSKNLEIHEETSYLVNLLEDTKLYDELGVTPSEFETFAKKAIYWREQSKFEFTRNLSEILDTVVTIGDIFGFNREDMANVNIKDLLNIYSTSSNLVSVLNESIKKGKYKHNVALQIELPSTIGDVSEVLAFTEQDAKANFVTSSKVTGTITLDLKQVSGKIVAIEGADPGYDWIFQKNILGLVTAYGGANSHMAIRCSELGIPAVIGVGDRMFQEVATANQAYLDCANKIIELF